MTDLEDDQITSNDLYTQAHKHFERAMDALQYLEKIDVEVGSFYLYTPSGVLIFREKTVFFSF